MSAKDKASGALLTVQTFLNATLHPSLHLGPLYSLPLHPVLPLSCQCSCGPGPRGPDFTMVVK